MTANGIGGTMDEVEQLRAKLAEVEREREEATESERKRVLDMVATDLETLTGIKWNPSSGVTLEVLLDKHTTTIRARATALAEALRKIEKLTDDVSEGNEWQVIPLVHQTADAALDQAGGGAQG